MTTDDRGESLAQSKAELQRAVDEKVAQAEAAAGSEPPVNAAPATRKRATKKATAGDGTPATKATATRAPAAKKAAPAKKATKATKKR